MNKTRKLVTAAMFATIVVVLTLVPYTGYIQYLPAGIEITTLHIPVIIAACLLGPGYGAAIGSVWGTTCMLRALTNPLWIQFGFANPLISIVPRILVGIVAGYVFIGIKKLMNHWASKRNNTTALGITPSFFGAVTGALTNTVLVIGALSVFGGMKGGSVADYFSNLVKVLVGINGVIELAAAAVLTPVILVALKSFVKPFEN